MIGSASIHLYLVSAFQTTQIFLSWEQYPSHAVFLTR
jgi:hypothetical protein